MSNIARLAHESGEALMRHWERRIAHLLGLDNSNLIQVENSPLALLLDMGAGIDFFIAYGGGRALAGLASRVQSRGVYATLTWRNRSTASELARACNAYLASDARVHADWCVHLYEERTTHHLRGVVAAHADDLARYYLDGRPVAHLQNQDDGTPFAAFYASQLRTAGVPLVEWWSPDDNPYQGKLPI
jgi:hypothetical protein